MEDNKNREYVDENEPVNAENETVEEEAVTEEAVEGDASTEDGSGDAAETKKDEESGSEESENGEEKDKFPKEKASFFKKKKDKKDEKIEELNDRLMRSMAEFENFRKRSEKEKAQMFEIGAKSIIEKILPVVDNFERGLASISEEEKQGGFAQGIEQIYKQLMSTLSDAGVKPIEAVGKEFNPDFHNAVMHGEDESLGENIVSEELQKGYMYKESVVRHSMVKVVN